MVEENSKLQAKRVCSECRSNTTVIHPGTKRKDGTAREHPHWFKDGKGGWLCKRCYMRNYYRKNPDYFSFKGKLLWKKTARPNTGVCNFCRAVMGEVNTQLGKLCKGMNTHHEAYDDFNPLAHTIEICNHCHGKLNGRGHKWFSG